MHQWGVGSNPVGDKNTAVGGKEEERLRVIQKEELPGKNLEKQRRN